MIQKSRGVTLFECLIYLALFSFIACSSMLIVARLWQSCIKSAQLERSRLSLYSAFDAFAQEIHAAPSLRTQWKLISPTSLVWPFPHKQNRDRGWIFKKNKLIRMEGVYHPSSTQWKQKTSSSVAQITEAQFSCEGTDHITHVTIYFSDGMTTIQETVALHNRMINA